MELAVLDDHRTDPGFLLLRLGHAGRTNSLAKSRQTGLSSKLPEPSLSLGFPQKVLPAPSSLKEKGECGGAGSEETEKLLSRGSDEEEDGGRKKLRLSKQQSAFLEERFKEHSNLSPKQKLALAQQLRLRPRQVEVWFQNRRARTKLKKTEADCEFLRRRCENLKDENRRLYREIQELKALKLVAAKAASLYLRFPPAKLAMCPSCEPGEASEATGTFTGEAGGGDK